MSTSPTLHTGNSKVASAQLKWQQAATVTLHQSKGGRSGRCQCCSLLPAGCLGASSVVQEHYALDPAGLGCACRDSNHKREKMEGKRTSGTHCLLGPAQHDHGVCGSGE